MKTLSDDMVNEKDDKYANIDIEELLRTEKKVVTFIGASKSGTSFILNNIARLLSSKGIDVAILDATQNKSSYYIYTKNEDKLRNIALKSIEELSHGIANGIKLKDNLTVYTGLPNQNKFLPQVEAILETLLKKHTLILIDCDFKTPVDYFLYAHQIYLVQSMDILTIPPLTEALLNIESKGVLNERKLRIIINKFVYIDGISEREIIGGMAFYNEPTMSYMKQLFDKNTIKYIVIPFEKEIYIKYLEGVAKCNINLNGYSSSFIQILEQLGDNIYSGS